MSMIPWQGLLEALEEDEQKEFLEEMISPKLYTMFVTPKDVDETVRYLSFTISEGLNLAFSDSPNRRGQVIKYHKR